jgi:chromosome segregation ATPase
MNKPKGGRSKVAKHPTIMRRIPEGIKQSVEYLSDLYRAEVWNGKIENLNLNLISSNCTQKNLVSLVQQLLSQMESEGWTQSLPSQLREEFFERVEVRRVSEQHKPDIENKEKTRLQEQLLEATEEIERLKAQLSSSISSTPEAETLSTEKPDIKYESAEGHRQLKEAKALIKRLERQVKAQAEQIQRLAKRDKKHREQREEYKQKWAEGERLLSQLTSQLEKAKEQAADREAVHQKHEELQQELESLRQKTAFLSAEAEDKQKMLTILHEAINPELQLVGKIKSLIQLALVAGRGEHRENIDAALHHLKIAMTVSNISLGYEYEKKALELVGEKPRRSNRKK